MELVKIDAKEFGLEESKAKDIELQFKPMLERMSELETEYNEIIKLEINAETCEKAHELRLKYVKVRTGTAEIHSKQKAFYLSGGRFVDGWKNAQIFASQGIEDKLSAIEKHYENFEKEKVLKLQEKRSKELEKYEVEVIPENLGDMPDEIWNNYLTGTKTNFENQKAAEKKAEDDRIAKEKEEEEKRKQIQLDNIRLQKEADEREKQAKKDEDERQKAETERLRKEEIERKKQEKEKEQAAIEFDKKLRLEQKEKQRIQDELQARKDAEEKAEADRIELEQAELTKGDSDKVNDLITELEELKVKYQFKSAKNQKMYSDVGILINKVITHINQ